MNVLFLSSIYVPKTQLERSKVPAWYTLSKLKVKWLHLCTIGCSMRCIWHSCLSKRMVLCDLLDKVVMKTE